MHSTSTFKGTELFLLKFSFTMIYTRKYLPRGYILGVSSNIRSSASPSLIMYCANLGFALPHGSQESEGDPKCIFFALNTYQGTFISDIL